MLADEKDHIELVISIKKQDLAELEANNVGVVAQYNAKKDMLLSQIAVLEEQLGKSVLSKS